MKPVFTACRQFTCLAFFLFFSTLHSICSAQDPIPNPDFENWTDNEPVGWNTINQTILGTPFACVTQDLFNPQNGTSSVKIETITQNIVLFGPVTLPGIVSLGEITLDIVNQTGTVSGGVPVETRPSALKGWFRYLPSPGDSCILGIGLFRWNGSGRDTLATSYAVLGGQNSNWHEFTIPIEYMIWEMPDTMNIMFFSSNLLTGSPVTGSKLWIDNLILEYGPVSVIEPVKVKDPALRYTPDGCSFTLTSPAKNMVEICILNLNGACVQRINPGSGLSEINVNITDLANGIYLARLTMSDGSVVSLKLVRF
ncbi:MAG: T9SS type A sorting domain-containing protein [Bacteroidota bacterium]